MLICYKKRMCVKYVHVLHILEINLSIKPWIASYVLFSLNHDHIESI